MTINYHSGRRIQGTSTDSTAVSGGWKEVGRTTLGSDASTITVSSLPDKRYYMVLTQGKTSQTNGDFALRYNGDSGSNYAVRQTWNGGSDNTYVNQSYIRPLGTVLDLPFLNIDYISNKSDKEKLIIGHGIDDTVSGAGTAPTREEHVAKWTNTSDALSQVQALLVNGSPNYRSGSEVVVLGWDEDDTHSTNFWEELGTANLSGGTADLLNITSFTAKKYLWIQYYIEESTANANARLTFNNDTGSNYAYRRSLNGGTDYTGTSKAYISPDGFEAGNKLVNMFIINNSATEKLIISNSITNATAGAGNAPTRCEMTFKWTNTSSQITRIDLTNSDSGEMGTGSILKVWGSN